MGPRPEPKITYEMAIQAAHNQVDRVYMPVIPFKIMKALLLSKPTWHLDKRVWYWEADGQILCYVTEEGAFYAGAPGVPPPLM